MDFNGFKKKSFRITPDPTSRCEGNIFNHFKIFNSFLVHITSHHFVRLNYTLNSIPTSPHFSVHPAVVLQTLIVILLFNLLTLFFHSLLTVHPLFIHFIFFIIFFISKKPTTIYINQHMSSSISRI